MAHQKVPNHSAEALGVWRHALGSHGGNDDACIGHLAGVSAVTTDDAEDLRAHFTREIERANEIHADIFFAIPTANAEDENPIARSQAGDAEPFREASLPTFVVHPCRQLAHVVGRRIRFDAAY